MFHMERGSRNTIIIVKGQDCGDEEDGTAAASTTVVSTTVAPFNARGRCGAAGAKGDLDKKVTGAETKRKDKEVGEYLCEAGMLCCHFGNLLTITICVRLACCAVVLRIM